MKKTNVILNGLMVLAMGLMFAQCAGNGNAGGPVASAPATGGASNMKIAYVEIDSLLTKYNFCKDVNEQMIKKEENIRTTLNEKAKKLEGEMREFERKIQNNGFEMRDSINSFLKMYNQTKGYDLIISNAGLDNLLYANPAYNITNEIVEGLNARYNPSIKK